MSPTPDLTTMVKAYDVRGTDDQLTPHVARALGAAIADVLTLPGDGDGLVVGRDMRPSSPAIADAVADGAASRGVDVVDIGLVSTDALTYASGHLLRDGVMVTASHNPAGHNGLKVCRAGAVPVSLESGLAAVRDRATRILADGLEPVATPGPRSTASIDDAYVAHLHAMVDTQALAALHIAIDAGNGMAGRMAPLVFDGLPITVDELFFELDGTFPNHPANPLDEANLEDLSRHVVAHGLPLGLAFDGDADRVFVVDENGRPVASSLVGAVVAERLLARHPGATVLHNVICSRTVAEVIAAAGGTAVRTPVGHSIIKERMADTGAVFAVEHSGHYYFRAFHRADSGLAAALVLLEVVSEEGAPLSAVLSPYERRVASGEINFTVPDVDAAIAAVEEEFRASDASIDHLDGLTVDFPTAWCNLRASNTEPLLRLNVEGDDHASMDALRIRVQDLISPFTAAAGL